MAPDTIGPGLLDEIHRIHQELAERAADGGRESVDAVLYLGAAVLLHGLLERLALHPGRELLDAAALRELEAEHARLSDDLRTLRELSLTSPASPDVETLAAAVFARLDGHLRRDARILYGPLARLARLRHDRAAPQPGRSMTVVIGRPGAARLA